MKQIQLTQGKYALVDDADYEWLNQWKWCYHQGYAKRYFGKVFIGMHRFIMQTPKSKETDHINGNGLDNQRFNLRIVTNSQNQINKRAFGKSKYKGVYFHKVNKNWCAEIGKQGNRVYIGSFPNERWAAMAYDLNAKELFGKYAKLNF